MRVISKLSRATKSLGGALLLSSALACSDFLEVSNPAVINRDEIDPVADAVTLANSAQQSYQSALGWLNMYGAWFQGEALVAETFPTRNEFGRRQVDVANGSFNTEVWFPLSQATASNALVIGLTLPNPTTNINYVRSHTWLGYSFLLMAEQFCEGTTRNGPALNTNTMLDSAIFHFGEAITKGTANGSAAALQLRNIARVGRARANLQRGNTAAAVTDATAVDAGFSFSFTFIDDPANRTRLSNRFWTFTFSRGSISVAPTFQSEPTGRVPWIFSASLPAQDPNSGQMAAQQKFPSFTAPLRVASKLEADYIVAEVGGNAAQLAHLQARRAAAGLAAYAGPTDDASVLQEFLLQKHYDFYLEGQRFGDWRRHPNAVTGVPVAGAAYFKTGFAPIGDQVCYPLPLAETNNNPNFLP